MQEEFWQNFAGPRRPAFFAPGLFPAALACYTPCKEVVCLEVIRAEGMPLAAGAYYVRVQAMARQHHIPLAEEFDAHDGPGTRYIVLVEDYLPVATCRLYPEDGDSVMIGRVVVLSEYRGKGLGRRCVAEAERWARELGFRQAVLESRLGKTGFYEKLGYRAEDGEVLHGVTFDCVRMTKRIEDEEEESC